MSDPRLKDLVTDIKKVLTDGVDSPRAVIEEDLKALGDTLSHRLTSKGDATTASSLRMSNLGSTCMRKLWYQVNKPELAEKLSPNAVLKFMYGDLLEWLMLLLAKLSGHTVTGQQTELNVEGIPGHRDAIIDGHLVDVKTASKYGYTKFEKNEVPKDDAFGYMDQLSLYHHASQPELEDKDTASFLAVEKETGQFTLDTYKINKDRDWVEEIKLKKEMVANPSPPERGFKDTPYGKSGNRALGVTCSYCPFKNECWGNPRVFMYSGRPVFFTHIEREPNVYEDKNR